MSLDEFVSGSFAVDKKCDDANIQNGRKVSIPGNIIDFYKGLKRDPFPSIEAQWGQVRVVVSSWTGHESVAG